MDYLVALARENPEGVVAPLAERREVTIGSVLVGLAAVADHPIDLAELDVRSRNTLHRIRCITWGDLARLTVGDLWTAPAAGALTVSRILSAAARRAANEPVIGGQDVVQSAEQVAVGPDLALVDRLIRDVARWAVRERGAQSLSDLLRLSPSLGRVPEEIQSAFDRLASAPIERFVRDDIDLPADLVEDLVSMASTRREVFVRRVLATEARPTLEELGTELNVSRERVRQVEVKAIEVTEGALATPRFAPLRWRADDLRDALGTAVPIACELLTDALAWATRGLHDAGDASAAALLLWIAGPYRRERGWLLCGDATMSNLEDRFATLQAGTSVLRADAAAPAMEALGINPRVLDEFVATTNRWRQLDDDTWAAWSGSVGDKAATVLELVGQPLSIDELNQFIGEGHAASSIRNAVAVDGRFTRIDKAGRFALAEWGLEEYSGIANELIERLTDVSDLEIERLVDEFVDLFGVSANSVRAYCGAPAFVVNRGRVRLRGNDEPFAVDTRVERHRGVYAAGSHGVIVHDVVDRDVLRGSGRVLPEPAAWMLAMAPGHRREFELSSEVSIVISWPKTSIIGPTIGSTRAVAQKLGLVEGERFRLRFDSAAGTVDAERVDPASLRGLTGIDVSEGNELVDVATALHIPPDAVHAALRGRGDQDVVEMLPSLVSSSALNDAIEEFGSLLEP